MLTPTQRESYEHDGYVVVPGLLDAEQTALLQEASRTDPALQANVLNRDDSEGGNTRLTLWREAGDDTFGLVARLDRIVAMAEACVGEPVYHFHSKLIQKEAREGGAWVWHQDYGYWYHDHFLYPRMVSCFIAVDAATRENGCMQVLAESHKIGRVDHVPMGDERGADPERVNAAKARCPLVHCELAPGDGLFFHCNVLHRSDQNQSEHPRWALICCYNGVSNGPIGETWQSDVTPLERITDADMKAAGVRFHAQEESFLKRR